MNFQFSISNFQLLIIFLLITGLILPGFCLAEEEPAQMPETVDEAKSWGINILKALPNAVGDVWQRQALPIWHNMWNWVKSTWNSSLGPIVESWWQKFLNLLGRETPELKEEFQKEKEEMQKDIWQRFKDLL